ncbi:MAG: c-type cytochrome, partial [Acidobacteriota bacterium]
MRVSRIAVVLVIAGAAMAAGRRDAPVSHDPHALPGWPLYERYCATCHGDRGDGKGPASPYTWGRPRAFASGNYEWRSTAIGQPPSDDDLKLAITYGARGTSMPAFGEVLPPADIAQLVEVVKAFAPATFSHAGAPVALGPARPADAARGAYLWTQLACDKCHGARGEGDGPAAKAMDEPPYDLVREPLRRPRAADDLQARRRAAALSVATGLAGTAMPGYAGQIADADVWALADQVVALYTKPAPRPLGAIDGNEIAADRRTPIPLGAPVPPQGAPPASLAPAEASLYARQCGRCHAKQLREWQLSLHAQATAVGFPARAHGLGSDEAQSCARCHAPLAEQASDDALHAEGVTCAGCHLRGWARHGPPRVASSLEPVASYPRVEDATYERADACAPCHQLPPRTAVDGKPLLNTYKEWLEGPYMRRGIQCQHCHMSNREHQWLGVHDRETFRQAIRLTASARRSGGKVEVTAELANVGAGHMLPTTTTPAVWLRVELFDARGVAIAGARYEQRIGRDVDFDGKAWHERADTRIPPGESIRIARAWSGGRTADTAFARVTVEVHPDDYYERLYAQLLATHLAPDARKLYEQAAARARHALPRRA